MRSRRAPGTGSRNSRLRGIAALSLAAALVATACGGDDGDDAATTTTEATTTTGEIPRPGGQPVSGLDACSLVSEARHEAYLAAVQAPPFERSNGDASEFASVCGWFVEGTTAEGFPDRLLLRVEPVYEGGNLVCEPPEDTEVGDLDLGESTGWVTDEAPVQTASVVSGWCAYLAAPHGSAADLEDVQEATTALLTEVQAQLPR